MPPRHVKLYMKHFDIGETDTWFCEHCGRQFLINNGLEIHHIIFRSHGGGDNVENCVCLCVGCHSDCHAEKISKEELQAVHDNFLK